jgi:hypothetical protein
VTQDARPSGVIPANAGIQGFSPTADWTPASAGVTEE